MKTLQPVSAKSAGVRVIDECDVPVHACPRQSYDPMNNLSNFARDCFVQQGMTLQSALLALVPLALSAAPTSFQTVTIPFEFRVDKVTLPAGSYRVESDFNSPMVTLRNVKTGRLVQKLRSSGAGKTAQLMFEHGSNGNVLTRIS